MRIRVVLKERAWALARTAHGWAQHWPDTTVSKHASPEADVNLYMNYALLERPSGTVDVAWFTHRRKDARMQQRFDLAAEMAHLCLAHSRTTALFLPRHKTHIVRPGVDPQFYVPGPVVFGVMAKRAEAGRKRLKWIRRLESIKNVEIRHTNGKVPWGGMPAWYGACDYILVLSDNEGGPMSVNEALAVKKPVIAPDVGLCWDWPVVRYRGYIELESIVRRLARGNRQVEGQAAMARHVYDHLGRAVAARTT